MDFKAYGLYSTGLLYQNSNPQKALKFFQKAIDKKPDYLHAITEASQSAGQLAGLPGQGSKGDAKEILKLEKLYLDKASSLVKKNKICDYKYAYLLMIKGIRLGKQHRINPARKNLYEAEKILKCLGMENSTNYAGLMLNIGNTFFSIGNHKRSLEYYYKAKDIYTGLGLKISLGNINTMNNIGNVPSDKKNYRKGLEIYFKTYEIGKKLRKKIPEFYDSTLVNIGTCYRLMGKRAIALKYYQRALKLIQELDLEDTYKHATLLINMAAYYEDARKRKLAAGMYRKAYTIYVELNYVGPLRELARKRAKLNQSYR